VSISVIIPTCEAGALLEPLIRSLQHQTVRPDEIVVIDSESSDGTAERARALGAKVIRILRKEFDHGGTRDKAFRQSCGEIVLFMTQDALPADEHYIEHLIAPFEDEKVGAAGGRQIARPDARAYERAVRAFSYPDENRMWDAADIDELGVRAFLISDVCSAYRRSSYELAGGFEQPLMTNEDMLMAASLLDAGFRLAYAGGAAVIHSHHYSLKQEYRRNHLIGRFMQRYQARLHHARETGTGMRLVKYVLGRLIRQRKFGECIAFCFNCAARLAGNRMGRWTEKKKEKTEQKTACAGQ